MNEIFKMSESCTIPLLDKDKEIVLGAKNKSNVPQEIQDGKEYQLKFTCSAIELKCKVYFVSIMNDFFSIYLTKTL
jgi:hypothetical protein